MDNEDDNLIYPEDDGEPPLNGPWRDGKVWVLNRKCDTCVFRPGNLMCLRKGRLDDMIQDCKDNNRAFACHHTLDGPRSICRGLFDVHYRDIPILQVADRLGFLAYDDPPDKEH